MTKIDCSIIFPLLNERENIINSYNVISKILNEEKVSFEIIYVDDGSTDDSADIIRDLCKKYKNVRLISFSRNFGQWPASTAGFLHARGRCAINMDIDLEEDPQVIRQMISAWKEGYEVITIKRKKRKENIFKRITAWMYYKLLKKLGCDNINNLADMRLLDRKAIDALANCVENNMYLRHKINWLGFKRKTFEAERTKRKFGKTKYNIRKLANAATSGIVCSTDRPLYISFGLSVVFHFLSLGSLVALIVLSAIQVGFDSAFWIIPLILTSTATVLMVLGIIGMYLAYTYQEVRNRPLFIVREKVNFED